jgi:hypothetical protein
MSWPALLLMTSSPGRIRDKVAPGTNSPQPSLYLIVNKLPSLSLSLSLSHTHTACIPRLVLARLRVYTW